MKKFICPVFIVLFVLVLIACSATTTEQEEAMIQSGDEIDGMLFLPLEDPLNWNHTLYFLCEQEPLEETDTSESIKCSTIPGASVFFGNCGGVLSETPEEADEK